MDLARNIVNNSILLGGLRARVIGQPKQVPGRDVLPSTEPKAFDGFARRDLPSKFLRHFVCPRAGVRLPLAWRSKCLGLLSSFGLWRSPLLRGAQRSLSLSDSWLLSGKVTPIPSTLLTLPFTEPPGWWAISRGPFRIPNCCCGRTGQVPRLCLSRAA